MKRRTKNMIVKTKDVNQAWTLFPNAEELTYADRRDAIPITDGDQPVELFPDHEELFWIESGEPFADGKRMMKWVRWLDEFDNVCLLVTDGPIYICNDNGTTFEAIR